MTRPVLVPPVDAAARRVAALAALVPTFETERLLLRVPRPEDWPALAPIWTTDRSVHIGGPYTAETAWLDFCQTIAGWLLRGCGGLTITTRSDGAVLGLVVLGLEWDDPEPELGWLLTEAAEGHGYAEEAARAIHAEAMSLFGTGGFVSYVARANARSRRLAERLGASATPFAGDDQMLVYRHGRLLPEIRR